MSIKNASSLLNQKTIVDITPFTTTDFADHLSCIVWFAKCNMRCLYCYNTNIVEAKEGKYSNNDLLEFLKNRIGLLDAVVLSGGEATLHDLKTLCTSIKKLGFKIKLDTNGLNSKLLKELLDNNLLDFVSLDFKAPHYKFQQITQCDKYETFEESLKLLITNLVKYEVRTTLHSDLLEVKDINFMSDYLYQIGYSNTYYLQHFLETSNNFGDLKSSQRSFDKHLIHTDKLAIIYRNEIALS